MSQCAFGLERKLRRLAAAAHLQILAVVPADGYALVGQVGDGEQHVLQFFFQLGLTRVVLLDAAGDFLKLLKNRRDVLSGLFERGDFLVFCVLARLLLLIVGDERAAGTVERDGLVHQRE